MAEPQRYVALTDVTLHVKDPDDDSVVNDANPKHASQTSVTLERGDSVAEDELAAHEAKAYGEGRLVGLIELVSASRAAKILQEAQGDNLSAFSRARRESAAE
jgi:hypothetical protein